MEAAHSGYKSMCVLREDRGLDKIRMSPWIEDLAESEERYA